MHSDSLESDGEGFYDGDEGKAREDLLVPRPVWSELVVLPRLQGLSATAVDTRRFRVCTATNMIFTNGKQLTMPIQLAPDGTVHTPRVLYCAPLLGCYLCVAGMNHLWACDLATLLPAGYTVLNDRKIMGCAFHSQRNEMVVSCADGLLRVLKVQSKLVRDEIRVRNKPLCDFESSRSWRENTWCEHLSLQEGMDRLFGASDTAIFMWTYSTGQKLAAVESAHRAKISCCSSFMVAGECRVATGDNKGGVRVWNVGTESLPPRSDFEAHPGAHVHSIVYEERVGSLVTYAAAVPCAKSWDLESGIATSDFACYPKDLQPDKSRMVPEDLKVGRQYIRQAGGEDMPSNAITPTSLKVSVLHNGRSIMILQQGSLVRCFSLSTECRVLANVSDTATKLFTMYQYGGASAIAVCMTKEGMIELINCDDGIMENVIDPGVSRDIFLLHQKGEFIPTGGLVKRKKKGKGNKKKLALDPDMAPAEKRAILAKRVILRVQKEKEKKMEAEGTLIRRKTKKPIKETESKAHFLGAVTGIEVVRNLERIAVSWNNDTIDLLNPENGVCEISYDKNVASKDDSQKLCCFGFIDPPVWSKLQSTPDEESDTAGPNPKGSVKFVEILEESAPVQSEITPHSEMHLVAGYSNGMVKIMSGWKESKVAGVSEIWAFKAAESVPILAMQYVHRCRSLVVLTARGGHYSVKQTLSLWNIDKVQSGEKECSRVIRSDEVTTNEIFQVKSNEHTVLALGYNDGVIQMWGIDGDGSLLLTGDPDDLTGGKIVLVWSLEGHAGPVGSIRASWDGSRLLTVSAVREAVVEWDVIRGTPMRTLEFTFQVHLAEYASTDYSVIVVNRAEMRRVPPADPTAYLRQAEKAKAEAAERDQRRAVDQFAADLDVLRDVQEAVENDFCEISARWGLATWKSISIKAFAEGYYGSTDFLGNFVSDMAVIDKSFQQAVEKELSIKAMYLFSRHKGYLQAKIADLANSQKLIALGDAHWFENRMFSVLGGSTKVLNEIRAQRKLRSQLEESASVEGGELSPHMSDPKKASASEDDEGWAGQGHAPHAHTRTHMVSSSGLHSASFKSAVSRSGAVSAPPLMGSLLSLPASTEVHGGGHGEIRSPGVRSGLGDDDSWDGQSSALRMPGSSMSDYEDIFQNNQSIIDAHKLLPYWIRSNVPLPSHLVPGGVTHRKANKVLTEEEEDLLIEAKAAAAKPKHGVTPFVHPLVKKSLGKQGLATQGVPTDPEEWDTPDVIEVLTRVRISELRRPRSSVGAAGLEIAQEEVGEKYKFGTSKLLDEILAKGGGVGDSPRGRSHSVPLLERGVWQHQEVPTHVGNVCIADAVHAEGRGGAHLPPSLHRLGLVPQETQASRLMEPGSSGITTPPTLPSSVNVSPLLMMNAPTWTPYSPDQMLSFTKVPPKTYGYNNPADRLLAKPLPALYPTKDIPHAELPDMTSRGGGVPLPPSGPARARSPDTSFNSLLAGAHALRALGVGGGGHWSEGEEVSMVLQGLKLHIAQSSERAQGTVQKARTILNGADHDLEKTVQPVDRDELFFDNRRCLDFFRVVRGLVPCVTSSKEDTCCFFAEVRLQGEGGVWEKVILKEAPAHTNYGLSQAMADALKPLFGLNAMDTRRVRFNAKIRKTYPSNPLWIMQDGTKNFGAIQTAAEGGTVYLLFRDYANGSPCTKLADLEGTYKRGKLKPGGGPFYHSEQLKIDFLVISAFRLMLEGRPFDLDSILVLPNGAVLPICEMEALQRRFPFRGGLGGAVGAGVCSDVLRVMLAPFVPEVLKRIEAWWENVSLGQVWDTLAYYGHTAHHLKRMIRNMRALTTKLQSLLRADLHMPLTVTLTEPSPHASRPLSRQSTHSLSDMKRTPKSADLPRTGSGRKISLMEGWLPATTTSET